MAGSGTIHVRKRDYRMENFLPAKLSSALWRAMEPHGHRLDQADCLAAAIFTYLQRASRSCVSSGAIREMAFVALEGVGFDRARQSMELHHYIKATSALPASCVAEAMV